MLELAGWSEEGRRAVAAARAYDLPVGEGVDVVGAVHCDQH